MSEELSETGSEARGPRCFVVGVCKSCERNAHRSAEHAHGCPQRRQKWYLRKLVPVIRTPFPAKDYIAVAREEIEDIVEAWEAGELNNAGSTFQRLKTLLTETCS